MKQKQSSEKTSGPAACCFLIALSEPSKVSATLVSISNISDCTSMHPDYFFILTWQFCVPGKEWIWLGSRVSSIPAETVPVAPMKTADVWMSWGNDLSLWVFWTRRPHHMCDVEFRATFSETAAYPEYRCHLCRSTPYSFPKNRKSFARKKIMKHYERKTTK